MNDDVIFAIPSCNAPQCDRTFGLWRERGFKCAVLANGEAMHADFVNADFVMREEKYRGWGGSFNYLATVLMAATDCKLFCTGGDDHRPDPTLTAQEIHRQFFERFPDGFGILQGTKHRWPTVVCDQIAGSPFIGREFARRWNGGKGAIDDRFVHHFSDRLLRVLTERAGVLWIRPDIEIYHDHYLIRRPRQCPEYMLPVYAHHFEDERLFKTLEAQGFPVDPPLP